MMPYCVTWDENVVIVDEDRKILFSSSIEASREVEGALKDPVRAGGPEDETLFVPGDPGFIANALLRLSPCTITGGPS